ncbi:MAG: hypothetical protein AB7V04_09640 [Desulfomonilaceae bacterium]
MSVNYPEIKQLGNRDFEQEWLRAYCDRINTPSVCLGDQLWYSTGSKIFIHVPCCGPTTLDNGRKTILWDSGALFIKYPVSLDNYGFMSYSYLVSDKNYDLETLTPHDRKEMIRALKKVHVEQIPIKDILGVAPAIIADTHRRQARPFNESVLREWMVTIEAAVDNPLFECWAAFVGKQVGAFRIDFTFGGGFYGEILFNVKELLRRQVMNALMFVSTREVIRRPHIDHVSYGMRSIYGDKPSLNRFKESLGYKKILLKERIEIAPKLKPLISHGIAHVGSRVLDKVDFVSQRVQKLNAILYMYSRQTGPEI